MLRGVVPARALQRCSVMMIELDEEMLATVSGGAVDPGDPPPEDCDEKNFLITNKTQARIIVGGGRVDYSTTGGI